MDSHLEILVIGDPHFRTKQVDIGDLLIIKCTKAVNKYKPDVVVVLGDILHTHNSTKQIPYNQAGKFIEALSQSCVVHVLIGNHDYINNSQFMSDNHFFNPMKKWENVFIVDKAQSFFYKNRKIVMCPYVPDGHFFEALNSVEDGWEDASLIFGHQTIHGVSEENNKVIECSDIWDDSYPPLISGHIHKPQMLNNVYYPGSAVQVDLNEDPEKRLWLVKLTDSKVGSLRDSDYSPFTFKKINLHIKGHKQETIKIEEVETFDVTLTKKYYIILKIEGVSDDFKEFRKSSKYKEFIENGIKVSFKPITTYKSLFDDISTKNRYDTSYKSVLEALVKTKSKNTQKAYEDLCNQDLTD